MTQFDSKLIAQAKKTKGYLLKKSNGLFSKWKNNYFIILQDYLTIFEDQTLQKIKKIINFSDIVHILSADQLQIQIKTKKKTYYFKTDNASNQDLWIASLNILKENYFQMIKNPKKSLSSSQSRQKHHNSSHKSSEVTDNTKTTSSPKKDFQNQKITYLLREKQLSRFLSLFNLDKLSIVTKEQKILSRVLFIQDRKNGIYFSLSSKSIYPVIDGDLIKQDLIYPYQLNVLYFLPIVQYKNGLQNKQKSLKLIQLCKLSEILQCTTSDFTMIKLQIHCQKPIELDVRYLSEIYVEGLICCMKKAIEVGKQYWNPKGKLLKNIDLFLEKFQENSQNQLVFYRMVEDQFQNSYNLNMKTSPDIRQIQTFFLKVDSLISNFKNFMDACQIKAVSLIQVKEKYAKLYHKFVYNYLSQTWNSIYKQASNEDFILYSKKVYTYYQILSLVHQDARVKQGAKTLLKISLKNFHTSILQVINNFTNADQESLRMLKNVQFQSLDKQIVTQPIFFNNFCTNFFSLLSLQFGSLSEIPKHQQFASIAWISMRHIFKTAFDSLLLIAQTCKERSSLISISNSLKFLRYKRIPQLLSSVQKTFLWAYKKQKQEFLNEVNFQIGNVQNFCVKKLFVITFSSIDKQLLKHEIKNMDFQKICFLVLEEISKLEYILPQVRVAMYQSAFQQVCYFLYICVVKFDNKLLNKDECLTMINQKMTAIKQAFFCKVDQEKIMLLLKDLNLLKQFITCPINSIKTVTRDIKKVFGSNFSQLNLKNLISLRVSSLKEKQNIFQQCRQEIKSSYNSSDDIQSFQRESFFNSSYRRQRKSTLTQSIQSYCEHFDKGQPKSKTQRTMLFGFSNSLKQGYLYRKKVMKNFNTSYTKFFYRLKKGKLIEFDNQFMDDCLNCYMLNQLKKCYIQPEKNDCIHLQFERQVIRLKTNNSDEANLWIQKLLQAMEEHKSLLKQINQVDPEEGVLFEDLSKKISFQTKQTNEASSPNEKQKQKYKRNVSPELGGFRIIQKRTQNNVSPHPNKKNVSPSRVNRAHQERSTKKKQPSFKKKKNKQKGCGTGCNFF